MGDKLAVLGIGELFGGRVCGVQEPLSVCGGLHVICPRREQAWLWTIRFAKFIEHSHETFTRASSSRTPHFRREDIADRLLLFQVDRLTSFGAESGLLGDLAAQRNQLMTELVGEVQRILRALEKTKGKSYASTFRIADFAEFVMRVEDAEGRLDQATQMFDRLSEEQLAFVVQDDPVLEILELWLARKGNVGRQVSAGQLLAELCELASQSSPPRTLEIKSAQKLGEYLTSNQATLKTLFGASDKPGRSRRRFWTFNPPEVADTQEPPVTGETETEDLTLLWQEIDNWPKFSISS